MMYFIKVAENSIDTKNINFLKFFRALCKYKDKGISVNQEMLYKFLTTRKRFEASLFYKLDLYESKMKLDFRDGRVNYLDGPRYSCNYQITKDSQVSYLIEQVNKSYFN
jgi:hypothetical protein